MNATEKDENKTEEKATHKHNKLKKERIKLLTQPQSRSGDEYDGIISRVPLRSREFAKEKTHTHSYTH